MKQSFLVSLCRKGLLGGWITADDEAITYQTGKLTVPPEFRNLKLPYSEICGVAKGRLLCLPTVSVAMRDGACHKFLVFDRKRFCSLLASKGICALSE